MSDSASSLRELDRVEDRIRMQCDVDKRPVLVVEGPTDLLVLRPLLPNVQIFPADGKTGALRAMRQLLSWGFTNVVAVIDRDFDDVTETSDIGEALHPYDARDLEGMLIGLGVLALIFEHQGDRDKIRRIGGSAGLVEKLKKIVRPVTALRGQNAAQGLTLSFSKIDLSNKMSSQSLDLDFGEYCKAIIAKSETNADLAMLLAAVGEHVEDGLGPRGKDVVAAGGVALRTVAGKLPVAATKEPQLTSQLHSSAGLAISESEWLRILKRKLTEETLKDYVSK